MRTTEIEKELENHGSFDENTIKDNAPPSLAYVLNGHIEKSKMSRSEIIRTLNVDRNYGYQILNGTRAPTRNALIRIALILELDIEQINYLLRLADKSPLYVRNVADAKVFYAVKHQMDYIEAVEFIWGRSII